jgi:hypothetical protein
MAHKKTKYDIKSKLFLKDGIDEYNQWWLDWDYDDYDYHDFYCDCYMCMPIEYEYLPDNEQPKPTDYVYRRGKIHVSRGTYSSGKMIDMKTIYSKEILRQKKLDAIFGGDYTLYGTKTYLKDILNEKSRNILGKLD